MIDYSHWYQTANDIVDYYLRRSGLWRVVESDGSFDKEDLIQEAVAYYWERFPDYDPGKNTENTFMHTCMMGAVQHYLLRRTTGFVGEQRLESRPQMVYVNHLDLLAEEEAGTDDYLDAWDLFSDTSDAVNVLIDEVDLNNELVKIVLRELPEDTAHMVLMRYGLDDEDEYDWSEVEIANVYDISQQAVNKRLRGALRRLSEVPEVQELYELFVGKLDA